MKNSLLRIEYVLPARKPLVSIIIPTRDKLELLRRCIDGLLHRTDYAPIEILVVNNRSEQPETLAWLAENADRGTIRLIEFDGDFNWGRINNQAVSHASGEIILLLNNDTEVVQPIWLSEMVAQALRPEIGVVGAKLLYPDRTVQHAGLILGPDGHAFHRFRYMQADDSGYRDELARVRSVSAVTGACLAMRRAVFDEVGGIEEQGLAVTWSDDDICLRVRERGYRVICTPFAVLLHLELATRGADNTPERARRAESERQFMLKKWPSLVLEDPHFNPNFCLAEGPTRLATPPRQNSRQDQSW
jgi:GT2 family glycosyltransferase